MPSKQVLKRGFKAEAERLSEYYRAELKLSKFDPIDAFALAKHLDIPIFTVKDLFLGNENHPIFFKMSDPASFSAVWMPNEDGDKIILHNHNHSSKRQQSNIMHELSHIIRGHEVPDDYAKLCMQLGLHYYNREHEEEAKYLGACLQISRPGLQWALKRNYTELQISEYFNASQEMVRFRLNTSGVLRQRNYMNSRQQ
jgi:Zn-dependent peptidase ImmA (M78 family)